MGLLRKRAEDALDGCAELSAFRRGGIKSFLSGLSDDQLLAMRIRDDASGDEIAGFLDREEKSGEDGLSDPVGPIMNTIHFAASPPTNVHESLERL